jgi:nicotinamidase-related amidase
MTALPSTLLDLAGSTAVPATLQASSLLIIDAQHEYLDGRLRLDGIDAALDEVAALLTRARAAAIPIVHVVQDGKPGGLFDPTASSGRVVARAAPLAGEPVVRKPRPNAFSATDLDFLLRSLGRRDVILAGVMTHMCVSATARTALDLGYRTTIVASTTATRNLPGPAGGDVVPAAVIQRTALAELADRFAAVVADVAGLG